MKGALTPATKTTMKEAPAMDLRPYTLPAVPDPSSDADPLQLCYAYVVGGYHYLQSLKDHGQIIKAEGGSICWDRRLALVTAQQGVTYDGEFGRHRAGVWRTRGLPCLNPQASEWSPMEGGWAELPAPSLLDPEVLWLGHRKKLNLPCNPLTPGVRWYRAIARHGSRIMSVEHECEVVFQCLRPPFEDELMVAWFPSGLADRDLRILLEAFVSGPVPGADDDPLPPGLEHLLRRIGAGDAVVTNTHGRRRLHHKRHQYSALQRAALMCGWARASLKEVGTWSAIERWLGEGAAWKLTRHGWSPSCAVEKADHHRKKVPGPWRDLLRLRDEGSWVVADGSPRGGVSFYDDPTWPSSQVYWPEGGLT
jgi:hypothetical protein